MSFKDLSPQVQFVHIMSNLHVLANDLGVIEIDDKASSPRSKNIILRWNTRSERNTGYKNFLKKWSDLTKDAGLSYTIMEKSSDSQKPISMNLVKSKGLPAKVNIRFKFKVSGNLYKLGKGDTYETKLQETLTMLVLAYNLKGGTGDFEQEMVEFGSDKFKSFKTKIGNNYVSSPDLSNENFVNDMASFLDDKPSWVDSINAAAALLESRCKFNKSGGWFLARPDDISSNNNPYTVWKNMKSKLRWGNIGDDKWNPGDIWFVSGPGQNKIAKEISESSREVNSPEQALNSLNAYNGFLIQNYQSGDIVGMSLKKFGNVKTGYTPHFEIVNEKTYFDEEVTLDKITLDESNQDVKLHLKVQKVNIDPKTKRRTLVQKYNKKVWLQMKTKAGGFRLELNIQGTEARHGSLGKDAQQKIITQTNKTGVDSIRKLRKEESYSGLNFGPDNGDNFLSYDLTKQAKSEDLDKIKSYVSNLYRNVTKGEISQRYLDNKSYLENKSIACEIGYVIDNSSKTSVDKILQNLYRYAASKGVSVGVDKPVIAADGTKQTVMNSSIYAKVY